MNRKEHKSKKEGYNNQRKKGFFKAWYEGQGVVLIPNNIAIALEPLCLSQTEATACIRKRYEHKST